MGVVIPRVAIAVDVDGVGEEVYAK